MIKTQNLTKNYHGLIAVDDLSAIVRASRLRAAQQCVRHEALIKQLI